MKIILILLFLIFPMMSSANDVPNNFILLEAIRDNQLSPSYDYDNDPNTLLHEEMLVSLGQLEVLGTEDSEPNYQKAHELFGGAAKNNHAVAQFYLGLMYRYGIGVKQDYEIAFTWFEKAAEQDYPEGYYNLGEMYEFGLGIKKDSEKAKIKYVFACIFKSVLCDKIQKK